MNNADKSIEVIKDKYGYVKEAELDGADRMYGLSKREHFAIEALKSLIIKQTNPNITHAMSAVRHADALLAALNQPQGE